MKLLFILIPLISFSSFVFSQEKTEDKREVKIVAHRGASRFAPENTIAAFLKAAEMGADYVEMDVRQTKDGHFIIMHDRTVNRTTNGMGLVSEMELDEIQKLEAGAHFSEKFSGEKVPTLSEALEAIKGKILPDIDFKDGNAEELVKILEEEGCLENGDVTLYSGWKNIKAVMEHTDKLLFRPSSKSGETGLDELIEKIDPPIVNISKSNFSEFYMREVHRQGKLAFVNALRRADNKKFMKRALEAGCDFLQADKLDVLIPLVKEHNLK